MSKHTRIQVVGASLTDCLRKLEKEAGLPNGDLSISDTKGVEVAGWPTGHEATKHNFISETSENIKLSPGMEGCIVGSVLKSHDSIAGIQYGATMHISKNCPGIYSDGGCTSCGDRSF